MVRDMVKEIRDKRRAEWKGFERSALDAIANKDRIKTLHDYFLNFNDDGNYRLELYREIRNEPNPGDCRYWIEAFWTKIRPVNIHKKFDAIEIHNDSSHGNYMLLLLLDFMDEPVAYGFLSMIDAMPLAASLTRAKGVSHITGDIQHLTFDMIGDPE